MRLSRKKKSESNANPVGRPRKDAPEIKRIILECLKEGVAFKYACNLAEIDKTTGYRWMEEDPVFATQCHAYKAMAIRMLVSKVTEKDAWKILKNIGKDEYKEHVNVVVDESIPIDVELPDGSTDSI